MKKTKNEPPSLNRSKNVSHKKGDDLNRRKTKASPDEEGTSNEEQESSDEVLSSSKRGSLNIKVWCRIGRIA
jgi:hypothetical protein